MNIQRFEVTVRAQQYVKDEGVYGFGAGEFVPVTKSELFLAIHEYLGGKKFEIELLAVDDLPSDIEKMRAELGV